MPCSKRDHRSGQDSQSGQRVVVRELANARITYELAATPKARRSGTHARVQLNTQTKGKEAAERIATLRLLNALADVLANSNFGGRDRRRGALAVAVDLHANLARLQGREFSPPEFRAWAQKNIPRVQPSEIDATIAGPVVAQRPSPAAVGCALHVTWDEWVVLRPWGVWPEGASAQDVKNVRASAERERCRMRKRKARGGLKRDPSVETISAASKRLGHSRTTLYAWREQGRLVLVNGLWTEMKTEQKVRGHNIQDKDIGQSVQRKRPRPQQRGRDSDAPSKQVTVPRFRNPELIARLYGTAVELWRKPAAA